ncbi:CD209 antigen-like protein C [Hyla sarda]|uniref:CD209 antigen-like protein C n=1 Tax=Hyla sarda TaxID=327740 RepID=UPI0024C2E617|nr:CD209 antigen-like protein C [Hyla sarda]
MYKNDAVSGGLEAGDNGYANEMMFRRVPPLPIIVNTGPTETGKGDSCFQKKWSRTSKVSFFVVIALFCKILIIVGVLFSAAGREGKQSNTMNGSSCKTCPSGWNLIRSNCYYFSSISETWESSKELCAERNGILVVIKDESEMSSLWPTIKQGAYWIGLRRDPKDTTMWVWTDGSPLTYSVWNKDEPNNQDSEHCAEVWGEFQAWNDQPCQRKLNYICKGVWNC